VAVCATLGVVLYWGFTVDDAFITARVAHHLSTGSGYRFNADGPIVDAVTPLGWAHVLSLFARHSALDGWVAARWLGVVSWCLSACWLGYDTKKASGSVVPFFLLSILAPVGAWASSGMETGVVIALVTLSSTRSRFGLIPAGLAAGMRPELSVYTFVLALSRAKTLRQLPLAVLLATLPVLCVALLRVIFFGYPFPLAAVAKPADLDAGVFYSLQSLLLAGPFWLWLSPGWKRLDRNEVGLALAVIAHLVAVALAGGDWMVLLRLVAPVLPIALRIAAFLNVGQRFYLRILPWVGAVAVTAYLGVHTALPGRHLVDQRMALVTEGRKLFGGAKVVAALDVGWVGIAHAGSVVDFAGVTNPRVAILPGGHTTKRIDAALLRVNDVDRVVLLLSPGENVQSPWEKSRFARGVEYRAAAFAQELGCAVDGTLPLRGTSQKYVVARCAPNPN
jgi:hypothetical protein